MIILIGLIFLALVSLVFIVFAVKAVEIVGLFFLLLIVVFVVTIVAVGYISFFVSGISVVALCQLWGEANSGWAFVVSGLFGALTAWALLSTIANEIKTFPIRIKRWLAQEKSSCD